MQRRDTLHKLKQNYISERIGQIWKIENFLDLMIRDGQI